MLEMCIAVFLIIYGYAIWDNFDVTDYNIAKINDKTNEVEMITKNIDNNNKLFIHNIGKNDNVVNIQIKIDKEQLINNENIILIFNNKKYNLNKLDYGEDNKYYCYFLENIELKKYETKEYIFSITNDQIKNYEFISI